MHNNWLVLLSLINSIRHAQKKRNVIFLMHFQLIFIGEDWMDVALDDFADCESNLGKCKAYYTGKSFFFICVKWINLNVITAANRQTRMLADLALVNCYNKTGMSQKERDRIMLSSAKRNLAGEYFLMS